MRYDFIFLDTETTGLGIYSGRTCCTGIGYLVPETEEKGFLYCGYGEKWSSHPQIGYLQELVDKYTPIYYNAHFDINVLEQLTPLKTKHWSEGRPYEDVYLMAFQAFPKAPGFDLKELAGSILGMVNEEEIAVEKWMADVKREEGVEVQKGAAPEELLRPYCLKDVEMTCDLYYVFSGKMGYYA